MFWGPSWRCSLCCAVLAPPSQPLLAYKPQVTHVRGTALPSQHPAPSPHLTSEMQFWGQLMMGLTVMVLHTEADVLPQTWGIDFLRAV